jgi:hypothetical protein
MKSLNAASTIARLLLVALVACRPAGETGALPMTADTADTDDSTPAPPPSMARLISHDRLLVHGARLSGRGPDFSPNVTREMWASLPSSTRKCSTELLDAQLSAHANHRPLAKRSFRNCDFTGSSAWLAEQLARFQTAMDANRRDEATLALGAAIAALHSFYAYSNYVELLDAQQANWSTVSGEAHFIWRDHAGKLADPSRLLSDFNPGSAPNVCNGVKPQLDKTTSETPAGKEVLSHLGISAHRAAVMLALEDTKALLKEAYRLRPAYGDECGATTVFGWGWPGWW